MLYSGEVFFANLFQIHRFKIKIMTYRFVSRLAGLPADCKSDLREIWAV